MKKILAILAAIVVGALGANAANLASDNAADVVYNDGWTSGDNGGSGFGAWTITAQNPPGGSGTFANGSSTANADGLDNGVVGGVASDGDIDTSSEAWGMYANNNNLVTAVRPLTGGSLSVSQGITLDMDNGYVENGGTVGFGLQNSSGQNVWEFYFVAGDANYTVNDDVPGATTIAYTDEGLNVAFTLTSASSYSAVITTRGGATQTVTGNLLNPAGGQTVDQIRLFNFNAGATTAQNLYFNSMAVVPEPSTMVLGALGLVGLVIARRRAAK